MRKGLTYAIALAALLAPAAAFAQAQSCAIPDILPRPHLDEASDRQPRRVMPIGDYKLALIWQPQHCRRAAMGAEDMQCDRDAKGRGFVLHGLWPNGVKPGTWPQYCAPTSILPPATLRANYCATPSVQLQQHEWAKHGTCVTRRPEDYFARSTRLYRALRFPDMARIARSGDISVGALSAAFAAANPGMRADGLRVTASDDNALSEIWVCYDTRLRYRRCPPRSGGLPQGARISVPPAR